jgi:hypothetical protein
MDICPFLESRLICRLPPRPIIISLVCGLRESRPATVRQTLDLLVEEEAVGDLILALSHLGKAMDEAGV